MSFPISPSFPSLPKSDHLALLMTFSFGKVDGVTSGTHLATLFYRGPSLPQSIYGDFLSIPSDSQSVGPASYRDAANALGPGDFRGFGETFGGSAINGPNVKYLEAFNHFKNHSLTFIDDFERNIFAFTPILQSQIEAGRRRGGNAINPPDGSYAAIVWQSQYKQGVAQISTAHEKGRELLIQQFVAVLDWWRPQLISLDILRIPPSLGLPLYIGETDAKQNSFATYGSYEFLKRTYAKYDPTR